MKRWLQGIAVAVLTVTPLVLVAPALHADGVNFGWGDCGTSGTADKAFACTSNTGSNLMVGSYFPPTGITQLTGMEVVIDLITATTPLPDWWQFKNVGTCHLTALGANFNYAGSSCSDYWGTAAGASGNVAAYQTPSPLPPEVGGDRGPNTARIKIVAAVDQSLAGPVNQGTEYFAFNCTISNTKSTGTGACAGCLSSACIVLNLIRLTNPNSFNDLTAAQGGQRQMLAWQGGAGSDCTVVPTHNITWGQIKNLYR